MAESALLVTGSNLGDRERNLEAARELVGARCGRVVAVSGIYESAPWGDVRGVDGLPAGSFLNQALRVETRLEPLELLDALQSIETQMGRRKSPGDGGGGKRQEYLSRIIDIDIIFYGERIIDHDRLRVPHPLASQREFVLRPVAEIAGDFHHPIFGATADEMLERLTGKKK
ncbi:MAG: 2-amino-4-hydroxy-6-hydroxymethyldihydropteridine diphosphokinase [Rikenellaceae bacterium]|nr:2-amino-4-hydroxy-6-hydroxymethyldihydropteridine diphosphokinase [Rikenellaceae bacterium]